MRRWDEAGWAALASGLSGVFGLLVLRPWRGDLDVPYAYAGDGNLYHSYLKGVLDHGWWWHNPNLGAPEGQQLFDYPGLGGDTLWVLLVHVLGVFFSDAAAVVNVFFLLTFPLAGLSAYLVLRRFAVSPPVATACSILFALLPYHFVRGEGHLLLSAYFAVPLGAYLVLAVLGDRPLFGERRRTLGTVGLCAVVALASATFYYSTFTIVLVASAAILRAVVSRGWRPLAQGGAVVGVILALTLVSLAPSFVYWAAHGSNEQVGHRESFESELYGLKFAQLVLPIEHHRLGPLADLRQEYDDWFPEALTEATFSTPLGAVASVGLLWLLAIALLQLASPGKRVARALDGQVAVAAVIAVLFAWTGGLATFVASVYPQLRSWNRLSIFIGFFALLAVGLLLDRALAGLRARRAGTALGAALLFGVLTIGVLDQTSTAFAPRYSSLAAEYRSDEAFVREIDERLPEGAMVLQLPYVPFPEQVPVQRMLDYDQLRGYLHSDDLRWSYGFVKGRPGNPAARLTGGESGQVLVRFARAEGFAGIYVDRFAYADGAATLEQELTAAIGAAPVISANGRLSFFEIPG